MSDPAASARHAAVIDVGSNSVRLVVYRQEGRAIWTLYNEKVLAGLGRELTATGRLSPEGVTAALGALRRFRAVLEGVRPAEVFAATTAAVREAADGPEFVRRVQAETGIVLRVLTGEEEARYSALGVLAGAPDARGVVGDLGGASLELTRLEETGPGEGASLPLGPFAAASLTDARAIHARLAPIAKRFQSSDLHAVGGAWRNLALLHMGMSGYPLRVVHQYEMSRAEALDAARLISRLSRASLAGIEGISKKRLETLPYAALVLEALVEQLGLERVVVSAYGLREGLLFEALPLGVRGLDPLIEGCSALGSRLAPAEHLGRALEAWIAPVFGLLKPVFGQRDPVLAAAACRLADLGSRLHPDHRADIVFEQVLRAPIAGQTHAERAFLATAVFARHSTAGDPRERATVAKVLTDERRRRARALGAAIRLGCDLSGRSIALLGKSRLTLEDGRLELSADPGFADMLLGEQTTRRATTLAQHLGVPLAIRRG